MAVGGAVTACGDDPAAPATPDPPAPPTVTVPHPDRAALVALYEATDGPNWVNNENWLTDAPLRDWAGVGTTGHGRVSSLWLRENGLRGAIPLELGELTSLEQVLLDGNQLTGPIPSELGRLSYLIRLYLDRNSLTGPIPSELGDLENLVFLDLQDNELSGQIPPELGRLTRLRWLWLFDNALTGPIPPELGNLASLESLGLSYNELSGPIPPELGKLRRLERLRVDHNYRLSGEIPSDVLALNMDIFESLGTGLCVPRTAGFESYVSKRLWSGYACGETEPGFQIQLLFSPETPDDIRDAMNSQAEYWMEILRDTEVPDVFGVGLCFSVRPWILPSPVIDDILVTVEYHDSGWTSGGVCYDRILGRRIPFNGYLDFDTAETRDPRWLELLARRGLGHALGIGSFVWGARGQLKNPSSSHEARDTYVVSPLAEEAFDAAGGTSYPGPKIPVQPDGSNGQWRASVFGSELMSGVWFVDSHIPTSAVTLQALADLGYKVDLSLADPYTLPGTAAAAALGADELPFELGWEAPPRFVVCGRPHDLLPEPETLRPGLLLRHARRDPCQSARATSSSSRSFPVPTPKALPSRIQLPRPPDN